MQHVQHMSDDFTLIRVSKPVVRRLNVAKSMKGKDQQVVVDDYLTESMDRDAIPLLGAPQDQAAATEARK